MQRHPNDFTRQVIRRYFADRGIDVQVNVADGGYVVFFSYFSAVEARDVDEPSGRLVWDRIGNGWLLYWISGNRRWHLYDRYRSLHGALAAMLSEEGANHFHKVL